MIILNTDIRKPQTVSKYIRLKVGDSMAVYVDYTYMKKDGTIKSGTTTFYNPSKAIRFIYSLMGRPNYSYDGFSCDSEDELEYMNRRL